MKRKLEQLNLLDDFLFGSMMSYPGIGEEFCRKILKILLQVDVGNIRIVPQKVYYGSDTNQHGARLDVYIEEDGETGTIYDMEPEQKNTAELKKALPRRVRFYHAKIDGRSLRSGNDYSKLKRVIVVFIMPFDPFGKDRIVYTIRNRCEEEPEMEYDDGAVTIFFNTKGKNGEVPEEVRKFLNYLEETHIENEESEWLREIHRMVEVVRHDEEVSLEYMKVYEREKMIREQGEKSGKRIGKRIGEKTGKKIGKKIGERTGEVRSNVKIIRNMRKTLDAEQAAKISGLDTVYVGKIFEYIENYPGESNKKIAARLISEKSKADRLCAHRGTVL